MPSDIYLKIDGIEGEAQDEKHKNEIEIMSFSFGVSNIGTGAVGKGSGAGKSDFSDLSVMKVMDKASVPIMMACATGKHISEATLTVRKAGGEKPVDYLKVKLTEVFISNYQTSGSDGGGIANDSFAINFAKINMVYTPQLADGTADAEIDKTWDVKEHKAA